MSKASALKSLFTPSPAKQQAQTAYLAIVAASRQPVFYKEWQVPDTLDGRFDMLVLHLFLALDACAANKEFCRTLQEAFFADMDRSLREIGVSDTGVGKRVKKMAQAFYGRMNAYAETIGDETKLKEALKRNVWREQPVEEKSLAALAQYARRHADSLRTNVTSPSFPEFLPLQKL